MSAAALAAPGADPVATVKNHVHNILEKLHVQSRGEAVAHLRGRGLAPVAATDVRAWI